jgi:hypothetical protein
MTSQGKDSTLPKVFYFSFKKENQKTMPSAGIIFRKQPELKWDSSSCPFPQGNSVLHPVLYITLYFCMDPGYAGYK